MVQILEPDGSVAAGAAIPPLDSETLLDMYSTMRLARRFDERAVALQRQGRLGTYPPMAGQEGAQIGSAFALEDSDWVHYQYREHAVVATRGLAPEYLLYWMGHESGNAWLAEQNFFPVNITIGGQLPHAVGMAWASALRGDDTVVICHFGDGATSEGDFHEAMNFAGVFDTPTVFFCNNNQWAISVPRERQTASETLAQKADAYGFEGIVVDGMDPLAVYQVTRDALDRARMPDGDRPRPTMIEAVQYRFGAHTTADDPSIYRSDDEVEQWRTRDPIPRFETFLRDRGLLDDQEIERIEEENETKIATLIEEAEAVSIDPAEMFEYTYAEMTPRLRSQREYLRTLRAKHGDQELTESK